MHHDVCALLIGALILFEFFETHALLLECMAASSPAQCWRFCALPRGTKPQTTGLVGQPGLQHRPDSDWAVLGPWLTPKHRPNPFIRCVSLSRSQWICTPNIVCDANKRAGRTNVPRIPVPPTANCALTSGSGRGVGLACLATQPLDWEIGSVGSGAADTTHKPIVNELEVIQLM